MQNLKNFWYAAKLSLGKPTLYLLIALVLLRIISLALYPLMDMTEGRYGEIARRMAESNDWITPWLDANRPFWGKPPLSFWVSAIGIKLFGVNEFAVRIPSVILGLVVSIISYDWAKREGLNPFHVTTLLITTFLFMVSSGAVMTDMALCVGTSLSLRGFWLSLKTTGSQKTREVCFIFAGMALMLLAKGPIGWILVLLPIGLWSALTKQIKTTWVQIPWITGTICAVLIVLPWYLLAEKQTPGFLNYFFIGEHWQRFTVSGWKGDLYGTAHAMPRGTIWLHLLFASLPWCILVPYYLFLDKKARQEPNQKQFSLFLLVSGLAPCLFFTVSQNILWTYVLPGLPSLALLSVVYTRHLQHTQIKRMLLIGVSLATCTMFIVLLMLTLGGKGDAKSAKGIVTLYKLHATTESLFFLGEQPYSAMFYSKGSVKYIALINDNQYQIKSKSAYIIIKKNQLNSLKSQQKNAFLVGSSGAYSLFQIRD